MPAVQQNIDLAALLGGELAEVNELYRDKPPDLRPQRLPSGIHNGIAKIQSMTIKIQERDDGRTPKGKAYCSGVAIVVSPEYHNNERVAGAPTHLTIPLCSIPERMDKDGKKISDAVPLHINFNKWRSIVQALAGCTGCPETKQSDPDGKKTSAYWTHAMRSLTAPNAKPVYVKFTTRGWKSPQRPGESKEQYERREEMVFEEWLGPATEEEVKAKVVAHDPAAGVNVRTLGVNGQAVPNIAHQPDPLSMPPQDTDPGNADGAMDDKEVVGLNQGVVNEEEHDLGAEIDALVEIAMADPEAATPEGEAACSRLEELAWKAGWSREQTIAAEDWEAIGEMARDLAPDTDEEAEEDIGPVVGSRWLFVKRDQKGAKLKVRGIEATPQEVEVTAVDANGTCAIKTVKDGKPVIDMKSKTPVAAKFEWLEPIQ